MAELLTTIKGEDGFVRIDNFYENVRPLTQLEIDTCNAIPVDEAALKEYYGLDHFVKGRAGGGYYYNLMFEPTINVNAIFAGYSGEGIKVSIPEVVTARLDIMLVPNMTMAEIEEKLCRHLCNHGFLDAEVNVIPGGFEPSRTYIEDPYVKACAQAVEDGFGVKPILFPGVGGGGPNYIFTDILGVPAVEIPFASADQNNHAPNENQLLSAFYSGIKTAAAVIERFPR